MLTSLAASQIINSARKSSKTSRYRPEIDGLRAFAVIAVIINHFNKDILPGGYLGVDIFFVISGYVITSSLFERPSKDFKDFISGFYERRIKRLVPALAVFVLIMSIAICLFNSYPGSSLITGITSLFGLSNLYLLKQSTDYFAQSTELNVFTHTWSLGVEEQFYILFPFLIWFSGFGRQTKNGARNLFLAVGALTIASLVAFLYLYQTNQPAAYFLMPSRFWEMAAGCLIFVGFQKRASIEQSLENVPPLIIVTLIVAVMFLPISMAAASTVAVVALSSILITCLKQETAAFKAFTNPKVVYIGLISYSLYLWHWGVLSISHWTIGIHWWSVPFQVAVMLGLAIASYRWLETPFRYSHHTLNRKTNIGLGLGLLATTSGFIYFNSTKHDLYFLGTKADIRQRGTNSLKMSLPADIIKSEWNGRNCWFHSSNSSTELKDIIRTCSFGNYNFSARRVIVIGNSSSPALAAMFAKTSENTNYSFLVYSNGSTPRKYKKTGLSVNSHYSDKFISSELFTQITETLRPGDAVLWAGDLHNLMETSDSYLGDKKRIFFTEGVNNFAQRLQDIEVKLLILGALPLARDAKCEPDSGIPQWFNSANPRNCSIPKKSETLAGAKKFYSLLGKEDQNIFLINLFNAFCPNERCTYIDESNGAVLYRDAAAHPSVEGALNASSLFRKQLIRALEVSD